ncbi:MAG TPA: DUF1816 domain-containing protein [Thermosynechococcaceae cyanobacterium]
MQEFLTNLLHSVGLAWWVEVTTDSPRCTYYFGPFLGHGEAEDHRIGYVEDLEQEGAQGIKTAIKRCKPSALTISDDATEKTGKPVATLSRQF